MARDEILPNAPVIIVQIHDCSGDLADVFAFVFGIEGVPSSFCRGYDALIFKLVLDESLLVFKSHDVSQVHPVFDSFLRCAFLDTFWKIFVVTCLKDYHQGRSTVRFVVPVYKELFRPDYAVEVSPDM